ncbi:MAG: hypothetical protein FJY76_03160 [Candidatus Aenigmarchaeota archaeon]|nr:hypothetical protein [Candidatus Aenigmarchaeota archaeon]
MRFWERPKKEMVVDIENDEAGEPFIRMRTRLFIHKGKITNYVVQLEHLVGEDWKQVIRFNCYHGIVHKDIYNMDGRQVRKVDMGSFSDLKDAVDFATNDIRGRYKEYIRRFYKEIQGRRLT